MNLLTIILILAAGTLQTAPEPMEALSLGARSAQGEGGQLIHLRAGSFDPLTQRIKSIADRDVDQAGYAVAQFLPGTTSTAMKVLREQGVRFHGYVPDDAYIFRLDPGVREIVASHESVRWQGDYQPEFKIHPLLWPNSGTLHTEVVVVPFRGESLEAITASIRKLGIATPIDIRENDPLPRLRLMVSAQDRDELIEHVAKISGVEWIEPWFEMRKDNATASSIIQGNGRSESDRVLFDHNLTGTGQIVAIADTGVDVDSCFFSYLNGVDAITEASNTDQPALGPLFPNNKIIGYWVQRDAAAYDDNETCPGGTATGFHGTHVAGSAVGDNRTNPSSPTNPGIDPGDGMAPNAQLLFQDVGAANGCLDGTADLYNTLLQAHAAGARTQSDSFGGGSGGSYTITDRLVDEFLFKYEEMSVFTSAGNAGPQGSSLSSPANSKNIIAVGSLSSSGDRITASGFSSRGPTADGRIKPDIVAPGSSIISAGGNSTFGDQNCSTRTLSGTSMAAPIAAGGSALVRQYFDEGRYPTGEPTSGNEMELTAPVMKAILLNGTRPLPDAGEFGGNTFGWGRMWLDNNLYFPGDSREMRVWGLKNESGLSEGETRSFQVTTSGQEELRVTLVWSDAPPSLASQLALVNDLDLTVSNGTETYHANDFNEQGLSIPGGGADRINNVEQIRIPSPADGTWTIRVAGTRIPGNGDFLTDRQGFGLVASHSTCETGVDTAPTRLSSSSNPVLGIDLRWESAPGSTATQVYRAPIDDPSNFQYVGSSSNGFFNDRRAQRGEMWVYRVRGADGCGEGPPSLTVTETSNSGCDLEPEFSGAISAKAASPNCAIVLDWDAATQRCNSGESITYNIYRSTDPSFLPALGTTPFASVDDVTTFIDNSVVSGVRYFYVVRAEDSSSGGDGPRGGAEDENMRRVSSVTSGPATGFGTWIDDAGDSSSLLNSDQLWHVTEELAHESQFSYFAGVEGGFYPALTCATLSTPPLLLGDTPVLEYWASYDLEVEWDGVIVEISTDDGDNWSDLPPDAGYPGTLAQTGTPPVNQCGYPASHGAFNGPTGPGITDWAPFTSDLSEFANQTVEIRWRFTSDPGDQQRGFYLDDISITDVGIPGDCLAVSLVPEAAFSYKPRSPLAGAPVFFEDLSASQPTSWSWDFGDDRTSSAQNPEHVYLEPGLYEVTLTVSNDAGSSSTTKTIRVFDNNLTYRTESVLPGQARAEGALGSFFKTSLWATNPTSTATTLRLRYLATPVSADGGAESAVIFEIEPNISIAFSDVLSEAFGATSNTAGSIVVEVADSFPSPIVTSRTYNEPGPFAGTSGQYIPSVPVEGSATTNRATIYGLAGDDAFRSNVGVVNLDELTLISIIRVLDAESGTPTGDPISVVVPPYSSVQINGVNSRAQLGSLSLFGVEVTGDRQLFVYASKLDNVTSDPTYIPSTLTARTRQWSDGVGAIPGGGGTFFRSNLSLTNPGATVATVTIDYTTRGSAAPAGAIDLNVEPGETLFFYDSVTELFPQIGGVGMFGYTSDQPVIAWIRTFNDKDLAGTLGQFIPAFGPEDLIPASGAILQGLSDNAGFRTNAGIVNVGSGLSQMRIEVWKRDGTMAGSKTYNVRSGEALSVPRVILDVVPGIELADGYLKLYPSVPSTMYVWASSVDNRSTDQTFYRPINLKP